MKFKITLNWTNITGTITLLWSIEKASEVGIWAGVILVLGRAALPAIENIIKAWKGQVQ